MITFTKLAHYIKKQNQTELDKYTALCQFKCQHTHPSCMIMEVSAVSLPEY